MVFDGNTSATVLPDIVKNSATPSNTFVALLFFLNCDIALLKPMNGIPDMTSAVKDSLSDSGSSHSASASSFLNVFLNPVLSIVVFHPFLMARLNLDGGFFFFFFFLALDLRILTISIYDVLIY